MHPHDFRFVLRGPAVHDLHPRRPGPACRPRDANRTVYSFSFSPIYQFESDFDHGGSFSVQRYGFNFDASKPVTNSLRAGISLGSEFEKYDFSGTTAFAGADP